MQVFSVVASMGVGSYWVAVAFLAAQILHLYTCRRFDRPMRALSRAMRQVTEGDFSVRVKPFHSENKFDYMDIMFEDFNRMAAGTWQHRDDEERLYRQRVPRDPTPLTD